jgi:hypothetical protein
MSTLTRIILESKAESKIYFQKRCQQKIEKFEKVKRSDTKEIYCPYCKQRFRYICKGKRRRKLMTSEGEINFMLQQVQCKNCKKIHRPLIRWLGLEPRQIITEELIDKSLEVAIHTSYKTASRLIKSLTGAKIGSRKIRDSMLKKGEEIKKHQANEPPQEFIAFCEDSTKVKTGTTKRGDDINIVYGIMGRKLMVNQKTGEIKRQLLTGKILSVEVGNDDKIKTQHKTKNVMSDGAGSVKKKAKYKDKNIIFHRCQWHLSRMLGFALYNDGLKTKKQRVPFVSKLALIIKHSFKNYKKYYNELIQELKEREYLKAVKYLQNAEEEFYNTKEKPIMIDGIPLLANSPIERVMREIDRRIEIGARWSKQGAEAITRVRLHYIYNN